MPKLLSKSEQAHLLLDMDVPTDGVPADGSGANGAQLATRPAPNAPDLRPRMPDGSVMYPKMAAELERYKQAHQAKAVSDHLSEQAKLARQGSDELHRQLAQKAIAELTGRREAAAAAQVTPTTPMAFNGAGDYWDASQVGVARRGAANAAVDAVPAAKPDVVQHRLAYYQQVVAKMAAGQRVSPEEAAYIQRVHGATDDVSSKAVEDEDAMHQRIQGVTGGTLSAAASRLSQPSSPAISGGGSTDGGGATGDY